jgi:hypothetical protein
MMPVALPLFFDGGGGGVIRGRTLMVAPLSYSCDDANGGRGKGDEQERLTTMPVALPLFFVRRGRWRRTRMRDDGLTLVISRDNGAIGEVVSRNGGHVVDNSNGVDGGKGEPRSRLAQEERLMTTPVALPLFFRCRGRGR